ncbi:TlpA disulfide reductase family protein [Lachnospiraceae bacterium 54-53]
MKPVLPLTKLEKTLIFILCILAAFTAAGVILLALYPHEDEKGLYRDSGDTDQWGQAGQKAEEASLDDITGILPDFCNLNEKIPDISFLDEAGREVSVRDFEGKVTVITFWASWCPDCREELSLVNEFLDIAEDYGEINYILVNKLDNEKETKEKAGEYLSRQGIRSGNYYDSGLAAYKKLGLHNIPTTLFLDEEGIIRAWSPRQITEGTVFEGYLKDAVEGSGNVTCDFVVSSMMDDRGGVHTFYDKSGEKTEASDVLSETQGAMLEYAVLKKDRELFEKTFSYITGVMRTDGLTAWKVTGSQASDVNALLDDFRIVDSLITANRLWGGYDETIRSYTEALVRYGVKNDQYVDFYDSRSKKHARRFTLCYGDLQAMSALAGEDETLIRPYENAKKLVTGGKISESFPLYYSWYNYKTNAYETDDLNTAEAMVTLLHLAEAGLLQQDTVSWLKEQMDKEGIKARYTVEGEVAEGYNYESTAVYALTAMIAEKTGDKELQGIALKKMEKMRIVNTSYAYHGAFGMEDGSGIYSFDQVMAMLAYEYTD